MSMARSVAQGSALKFEQATLDGLRTSYDTLAAEHNALCQAYRDGRGGLVSDIQRLEADLSELRDKIASRRTKVTKLRLERSKVVTAELSSLRKQAAARALAALQELDEASEILIAFCEEIRFAGDHEAPYLSMVPSFYMREHAKGILGK
ncbi:MULTISPECIES: protein bicaudal D homolog [unclassified Bradyrhizobium]|uniref:protein bicaudal D homolog n=1 Tax=unclassified Bradyrhizobium TaxID=2631580 RepID=UPI001FFAB47D|nr:MULTISPECIES: protein bicaudal D homolog [unclassified Bradyrhizobium]MCK1712100.1 hypothetical protein [Bradyrhizobium sp. 143]MCK1732076.1 hypothetical protein [Bradyrhizobium sp. 142]